MQTHYPFVPPGFVPEAGPPLGRIHGTVIQIHREQVWSIRVVEGDDRLPDVHYVYDSGYEGDVSVPERMAHETIDQAIAAGYQQMKDYQYRFHHMGPFLGVMIVGSEEA